MCGIVGICGLGPGRPVEAGTLRGMLGMIRHRGPDQFGIYLEKYPKSGLTASARLMYALCLTSLHKNPAEARQYLESVVADFPSSPEAKAAERNLKKLAAAGAKKAAAATP